MIQAVSGRVGVLGHIGVASAFIVVTAVELAGLADPAEIPLRDRLHAFAVPAGGWPADLRLVRIDTAAQDRYGRWPWPRPLQADLLDRIGDSGARTVLYDFHLSGATDGADDRRLADALARTRVVLPALVVPGQGVADPAWLDGHLDGPLSPGARIAGERLHPPSREFLPEAAAVGHVWFDADRDGAVRRMRPFLPVAGRDGSLPSLALQALSLQEGWDVGEVRWERDALVLPGGRGFPRERESVRMAPMRAGDMPASVSAAEVLAGDTAGMQGALVLVHLDLPGKDQLATTAGAQTPGGLLTANAIRTLRNGSVRAVGAGGPLAILAFLALLLASGIGRATPRTATLVTLAAAVAYLLAALALARFAQLLLPLFLPLAFLAIAGTVATLQATRALRARLERAEARADAGRAPRGTVTLVFTDVQGSTSLWEHAPEAMAQGLEIHNAVLRALLEEAGGYEVKTEGDAFMLAFGDPFPAVAFCLRAQEELLRAPWPAALLAREDAAEERDGEGRIVRRGLRVRMGAHTAELEPVEDPKTGRADYFGPPVNRAARIGAAATGGGILLGEATWTAVAPHRASLPAFVHRSFEPVYLKGLLAPERTVGIVPAPLEARGIPEPRTGEPSIPEMDLNAARRAPR